MAWLKDGKPLAAGGRVAFAADMSSVMIKPLQKEDNGMYTCELSNAVSKVTDSYKMEVNCECVTAGVGVGGGRSGSGSGCITVCRMFALGETSFTAITSTES